MPTRAITALRHPRWVWHDDARGFRVRKPAPWQVTVKHPGEVTVQAPDGMAVAVVRAHALAGQTHLLRWLREHFATLEPGLHNVRVDRAQATSPHLARLAFDYGSHVFQGRAGVLAWRHGDVVTLFVAAAARMQFARRVDDLAGVLGSLRFDNVDAPFALEHPDSAQTMAVVARGAYFFNAITPWHPAGRTSGTSTRPWGAADFALVLRGDA